LSSATRTGSTSGGSIFSNDSTEDQLSGLRKAEHGEGWETHGAESRSRIRRQIVGIEDGQAEAHRLEQQGSSNHAAMVSLYFMYYNFARVHQTLRVTPAMEAGIANHVWSIEEIVRLLG
jgi:hypothetical protein